MNKIYLGIEKFRFYPRYYVAVNEKVLRQSESEIRNLNCVKFLSNRCPDLFRNDALTHIMDTSSPHPRFCKNLLDGCEEGGTVTFAALQIAYYLGFSKVVIIGMDHKFSFTGKPNASAYMDGADENHFASNYFGFGQSWDNPDLVRSEASYSLAKEIFESEGRSIIDATADGHCDIFEKAQLESIF